MHRPQRSPIGSACELIHASTAFLGVGQSEPSEVWGAAVRLLLASHSNGLVGAGVAGLVSVALGLAGLMVAPAYAAPVVRVMMASDGSLAIHRPVFLGSPVGFEIDATDTTITSVSWASNDSTVATVSGDAAGAVVTGVNEGVTRVTATATTADGVLSDSVVLSVGTSFDSVSGSVLNKATDVLADARAGAEAAATWPAGRSVTVAGVSGGFFLVEPPTGGYPDLPDGGVARWVEQADVDVPPTGVVVTPPLLDLEVGAVSDKSGFPSRSEASLTTPAPRRGGTRPVSRCRSSGH